MVKTNITDRRHKFLLLAATFLITLSLSGFCIFKGHGVKKNVSKEVLMTLLNEEAAFEADIIANRESIDTVRKLILTLDPTVNASFLANDIKYLLGSVRSTYDRNPSDPRYKTFLHVNMLYHTLFFNRRELNGNHRDLEELKKNLSDCQLSTRQIKEAISQQANR